MSRSLRVSMVLALLAGFGAVAAHAAGDPANGEKIFAKCKACHTVEVGKNKIGPSLAGVVGRKSGTAPNFNYSDAMKNAGLTWDEATLDTYLTNPKKLV